MGQERRRDIRRVSVASSGEQYTISHDAYEATIAEVGATLRSLQADGLPLVEAFALDATCDAGHGQLLLPWPNRIADAAYEFDNHHFRLAVTEPATGCAIHGLTRWANWRCLEHGSSHVTLLHRLHPQPGWPGVLDLTATYRLDDNGLTVTVHAHNVGATRVPFGAGAHPYLIAGGEVIDEWTLTVPAATVVTTDARGLPTVRVPVEGTDFDFRTPQPIGAKRLDNPFTNLMADADGSVAVHLAAPNGHALTLWVDSHHRWFQVFTGDSLPAPRRRRAVAIEPMTCPPNAFRTGEDLIVLAPDESVTLRWGICTARHLAPEPPSERWDVSHRMDA